MGRLWDSVRGIYRGEHYVATCHRPWSPRERKATRWALLIVESKHEEIQAAVIRKMTHG